jgi:hypothetical protein
LTCNALFLKSPIFLIRVDVDKKNPKNKKNQIYNKKKELRDQVGNLAIFLPINTGLHNTHKGGILHIEEATKTKT